MIDKESIKRFVDKRDTDYYIVEYTLCSILPKEYAEQEYDTIHYADNVKLYKVNEDYSTTLVKEK